jgi:hypothetical protein
MALHIVKLCVGVASIEELAAWQSERLAEQAARGERPRLFHATLQTPKRQKELAGGSLYWVIRGLIQVRQRLAGFEEGQREDGSPCCLMLLDPALVPVRPVPRRAFQGWRYLKEADAPRDLGSSSAAQMALPPQLRQEEDAPADLGGGSGDLAQIPPEMRRALTELGLI